MITITVANRKGGVGKTTITRILVEWFALVRKQRVLVVDLDSQCSLSKILIDMESDGKDGAMPPVHQDYDGEEDWNGRSSSADIYYDGYVFPYKSDHIEGGSIEVLPGHKIKLENVEEQKKEDLVRKVKNRLREFVNGEDVRANYDVVIVDTGPSSSPLAKSALKAADFVVVPAIMEPQCIGGIAEFAREILNEKKERPSHERLDWLIQVNMFHGRRSIDNSLVNELEEGFGEFVGPVKLPDKVQFVERDLKGVRPKSIFQLNKKDSCRQRSEAMCHHLESKLDEMRGS